MLELAFKQFTHREPTSSMTWSTSLPD